MSDESHTSPPAGSPDVDAQLFDAARRGDVGVLTALLDKHPEKLQLRTTPHEHTLLHLAAFAGHVPSVDLLLTRGLDVNARDDAIKGDNSCAMHWAAAAGHLDVVRRLADAGGDIVGHGDDHALGVIGWATCWEQCHPAVAAFLVSRGARHHIFSAISMNLADEVRRIVAADAAVLARPMSRNEDFRLPLHHAVQKNRPEMVALLLELGADPMATDGSGFPALAYATTPDSDRRMMETVVARGGTMDLFAALALGEWETAARFLRERPDIVAPGGASAGVLHLMAKRNNGAAVKWLLDHGLDPNARWSHWDAEVTPLHLAASRGHADVVRRLLDAGADPRVRDSKHDGDAIGWAGHFGQPEIVEILRSHEARRSS